MPATITANLILGAPADGESYTGQSMRLGAASHATIVGGSSPLLSRGGIIPAGGSPLDVQALTSTSVTVKAGTAVVQANQAGQGVHSATLTVDSVLDTITGDASNPRIDVVVLEVVADGSGAGTLATIKRVVGTAAPSPTRPSLASPPGSGSWLPLAQLTVAASGTPGITISKVAGVDGVFTVAPGGILPVAAATESDLAPSQFFVLPGGELWWRRPNNSTNYEYGIMARYFHGINVNVPGSGDITLNTGEWRSGVWSASPFPNACLGAVLVNRTNPATFNEPVQFQPYTFASNSVTFRAYRVHAHTVFSGNLDVTGYAWGW